MGKDKVIFNGKKFYKHPVFSDYAASKDAQVFSLKRKKLLKSFDNGQGYLKFKICQNGKQISYYVHRFVYECIKGVIPEGMHTDHIDFCKTNNSIYNLQLLTPRENVQKSRNRKVVAVNLKTDEKNNFISITIASEKLGINRQNISTICKKSKRRKKAQSKVDSNWYTFEYSN